MKKQEWFYDEDFWEHYAPVIFTGSRMAEAPEAADAVTRLAALNLYEKKTAKSGPLILDLCCGFGRITLELARRGFIATGVDITEYYLCKARQDAAYEKLKIEFIKEDIRSFKRENTYDTAINLYNSFGYFENEKDNLLFLKNVYSSLKEGGSFIMDVMGKEIAVRDFTEADWFEISGLTFLVNNCPVDSWTSQRCRWILLDQYGKHREKIFTQRLYAASELRSLFLEAGFSAVELYGGWDESPYDDKAHTLIAVGRK